MNISSFTLSMNGEWVRCDLATQIPPKFHYIAYNYEIPTHRFVSRFFHSVSSELLCVVFNCTYYCYWPHFSADRNFWNSNSCTNKLSHPYTSKVPILRNLDWMVHAFEQQTMSKLRLCSCKPQWKLNVNVECWIVNVNVIVMYTNYKFLSVSA